MSKHTAGPWTVEYDGSIVMSGQVIMSPPGPDGSSLAERKANARLIAAAPDMLEALIRCHDIILAQQDEMKIGEYERLLASAAISKAKGE